MLCEKLYCLQLVATNSISYIHIMPFKYKVIPPSQSVWVNKIEQILIIQNRWKGYSISWHRIVYSQKWKYVSIYWLTQVLMCSLFQHKIPDFDTSTFIVKQNVHVHMHLPWHKTHRNYIMDVLFLLYPVCLASFSMKILHRAFSTVFHKGRCLGWLKEHILIHQ